MPVVVGCQEHQKIFFLSWRPYNSPCFEQQEASYQRKNVHVVNLERLSDVISNGGFGDIDISQVWVTGGAQVYGCFEECADVVVETTIAVTTPYDAWFDHRKNGFFSRASNFQFQTGRKRPRSAMTYWIDRSRSKLTVNRVLCNLGLEWFYD